MRVCPGRNQQGVPCVVKAPAATVPSASIKTLKGEPISEIALFLLRENHAKFNNIPLPERPLGMFKPRADRGLRARAAEYHPEHDPAHDDDDDTFHAETEDYNDGYSASAAWTTPRLARPSATP